MRHSLVRQRTGGAATPGAWPSKTPAHASTVLREVVVTPGGPPGAWPSKTPVAREVVTPANEHP